MFGLRDMTDRTYVDFGYDIHTDRWSCIPCGEHRASQEFRHAVVHETSVTHQRAVRRYMQVLHAQNILDHHEQSQPIFLRDVLDPPSNHANLYTHLSASTLVSGASHDEADSLNSPSFDIDQPPARAASPAPMPTTTPELHSLGQRIVDEALQVATEAGQLPLTGIPADRAALTGSRLGSLIFLDAAVGI
jgi:hypothetical protein